MTEPDLQRWTREVAEDPGAPSFVRLARAYRRQGRRSAARDVVLAGLAANPEHVDAHSLLALIHIEDGQRQQAGDEWEIVLRLDPGNFDASRGLGFLALERGDLSAARRHLDTAFRARPDDPAVTQARQVLDRREQAESVGGATEPRRQPPEPDEPAREAAPARDPTLLFSALEGEGPFGGALLLDDQGLVLAGRLTGDGRSADLLGALLTTTVAEGRRTADMLRLGDWGETLLETGEATLHLMALTDAAVLVVVAERGTPAGWVVRTAGRARAMAARFLEEEQ